MEGNEGVSMSGMGAGTATMSGPSASNANNSPTSIEVNSPKGNNAFSSKGLSMFKDVGKFNAEKPMLDISKPSFEEHVVPHQESPKPEASENSIIDINNGKEEKPFFNRPESFNSQQTIIDISKPFEETPKVESFRTEEKVPQAKPTELKENTAFHFAPSFRTETKLEAKVSLESKLDPESQIDPSEKAVEHEVLKFENSEPDLEVKNNAEVSTFENHEEVEKESDHEPEVRTEFYPSQKEELKTETHPEVKTDTNTKTSEYPQPQVEIKKGHATSSETRTETYQGLETLLTVTTETQSKVATELKEEIEYANTQILPELQRQTSEPVIKVREAIAIEIAKENPDVVELPKDLDEEVRLSKNDKSLEAKAKALFEKRQLEKNGFVKPNSGEMGILYFKKDKDTNNFRETMMIMRAEKEILKKGSVDGRDMASAIQKESLDATSEIVRGYDDDGTLEGVSEEVGMLGKFTDVTDVKRAIRGIIEKLTAVKLSKSSSDSVSKEDAEQVYQKELDGVSANLKEENSEGVLLQAGNGRTIYVSGARPTGEPMEDELYTSAA